jgi:hypothetical protein
VRAGVRRLVVVVSILAVMAGCGRATGPSAPSAPAASDAGSHVPGPAGLDWATAEVERPAGMDATPPSIPPVGSGGGLGHPGHFSGQGNPYDLAAVGDRLIAVGYTYPDFHAVAWTSRDRHAWTLADLQPGTDDAFASGIAAGLDSGPTHGHVAIVGRIANDAAAWTSTDGTTWTPATGGAAFVEAPQTEMTTVVAGPHGFVAGGSAGITNQPGRPRFWASTDGTTWARLPIDDAGGDGRVTAIAGGPLGFVAVGTTGPVGHATGSAVWTSADGSSWRRLPDSPPLGKGQMLSVTAGGPGWVAVGSNLATTAAMAWLSSDGTRWDPAPAQDALTYHDLGITMVDVTTNPAGQLVAVGHFLFGTQYGRGTAWTSDNAGIAWTRMPDEAAFGQGEPQTVIADGPGYVAAGTVGAPDNYIPTVWLSPSDR